MSLTARHLEASGIPTVVLGSARDIVEHAGAPRFLFVDFPLGNPAGAPYDRPMQQDIARRAMRLLTEATGPNTTWRAPLDWPGDPDWRAVYNRLEGIDPAVLQAEAKRRRERFAKMPPRNAPKASGGGAG